MPAITEASGAQSQYRALLDASVDQLSSRQTVQFQLYSTVALSQDGFIFWVPAYETIAVVGALHYSDDILQDEDQTVASTQVIFSAEEEITEFNLTKPGYLWIGTWTVAQGAAAFQIAFSSRGSYFGPANIWHYSGIAILAPMSAQIVTSKEQIPSGPIVSNSLPFWLTQSALAPVYPSFLVPQNAKPPYVVAHIDPAHTEAIQAFPLETGWPDPLPNPLQPTLYQMTTHQLSRDQVRLTFYGFNAQMAQQFLMTLIDYSRSTDNFGFQSNPVFRDEKRTQREIMTIAQKKTLDLTVSYYQGAADAVARRLIVQALVSTSTATP